MDFALWSVIVGLLLVLMALASTVLKRLPLSTAMLYVLVGIAVSPIGLALVRAEPRAHAMILERMAEVVVLLSLFTAGLKLSPGLTDRRWRLPVRLAVNSMVLTVALISIVGWFFLDLPLGACVLLGAILAPTDPVLASDVQLQQPGDTDRLRFALTGEGGLNDGTAFPFVMLGLGLLGLHELGAFGWRWLAVDVVWATAAGLATGWVLGMVVGRLVLHLRREHKEAVGLDDFLALGLIGLAYGCALLLHAYGFLAVFAAGVALRRIERRNVVDDEEASGSAPTAVAVASPLVSVDAREMAATDAKTAPAFMAQAVLVFNEQIERIGEIFVVLLIGGLINASLVSLEAAIIVVVLVFVVRPLAVILGLKGADVTRDQRALIGWFGVRGVGSLYYLTYAITHGLAPDVAQRIGGIVLAVLTVSIVVHGISVTPMMNRYSRRARAKESANESAQTSGEHAAAGVR